MIEIFAKIHDKFSLEFKIGYNIPRKIEEMDFVVNTWMFVPNSLDISPVTYSSSQFYRDIKSNVRLITPVFLMRDIAYGSAVPLKNLEKSVREFSSDPTRATLAEYEYQIKMFAAIFKSAIRDEIRHIAANTIDEDIEYLTSAYIDNITGITTRYRELRRIINVPTVEPKSRGYFHFGDEFMSNIIEQHTFFLMSRLTSHGRHDAMVERLRELVEHERAYKLEMGYLVVDTGSPNRNRDLVFRQSVLKKYIESDLFLNARKQKDGILVEQIYYSLAAGLSMIFATAIAFSFQQKYGSFTMPLFVALVVSYMLKDRIKALMRYYFAHRLRAKYFDNKTLISVKDTPIGWIKDGADFITDDKVLPEVMEIRSRSPLLEAENRVNDEKILLYRKLVRLDRRKLDVNEYMIAGVNDIVRVHVTHFTRKMDNPETPLYVSDDNGGVELIQGEKIYYLNLVMQLQCEGQTTYKRYRVVMNRLGISELEELK